MHQHRQALHCLLHCPYQSTHIQLDCRGLRAGSSCRIGRSTAFVYSQSHGNFCEYAWGGLLLLGLAELQVAAAPWLLHLIGATLTAGRVLYSIASSVPKAELKVTGNKRISTRKHGA